MTIYYLMVKTHTITGLKYLCQTKKKDPHKYLGSGKHWLLHLNKHGKTILTEIIRECQSKDELKEWGLHYSELWNVTESGAWANLMEENGGGGKTTEEPWNKGKPSTPAMIQKMKDAILRRTDDTKEKMILSGKKSYEKTFALLTKEQRHEKYMNGLGKLTAEERRINGSIKGKKGGEKWSKASAGQVTVTDKFGFSKRIPQQLFLNMKSEMLSRNIPMVDWDFVQVSSTESKRRKVN